MIVRKVSTHFCFKPWDSMAGHDDFASLRMAIDSTSSAEENIQIVGSGAILKHLALTVWQGRDERFLQPPKWGLRRELNKWLGKFPERFRDHYRVGEIIP